MISLASTHDLLGALERAKQVELCAYVLCPGPLVDALKAAARRGADVHVRLEGAPYKAPGVARLNARVASSLRAGGVDARLAGGSVPGGASLHAKMAVVDARCYLDDCNWLASGDTVLVDDSAADCVAARAAIEGESAPKSANLATNKRAALAGEADLLASASPRARVEVESESFGYGNAVYAQLDALARVGRHPRLLVAASEARGNARERSALQRLQRDGVEVRVSTSNEKFALAGSRGWVGSANATAAFEHPDRIDWGLRTDRPDVLAHLRSAFAQHWSQAHALKRRERDVW